MGVEPSRFEAANLPRRATLVLSGVLVFARLLTVLTLPLPGLHGYGDMPWFYAVAGLDGWPYLHTWAEFPPIFPFLAELIYRLTGGSEAAFTYALILVFTLADLGSLWVIGRLARCLHDPLRALMRQLIAGLILILLPYAWWYFDPLAVFCMLLGLDLLLDGKAARGGLALGLGMLIKFFPAIGLVLAWRILTPRRAALTTVITLGAAGVVFAGLWAISPEFTRASLASQASKGSWETIWALLDGNYNTGLFGVLTERYDPSAAYLSQYNPATVSPLVVMAGSGLVGLVGFLRARRESFLAGISLVGLAWCLFLIASPGWSPQWVLYLLPLILLAFPLRIAALLAVVMILVNVAEWPVALAHGRPDVLAITIILRTLLLALMAVLFYRQVRSGELLPDGQAAK